MPQVGQGIVFVFMNAITVTDHDYCGQLAQPTFSDTQKNVAAIWGHHRICAILYAKVGACAAAPEYPAMDSDRL
jgi:hypothetical protein